MKLSERYEAGGSYGADFLHIVRDGVSYKTKISSFLDNARLPIRWSIDEAEGNRYELVIFKKDPEAQTTPIMENGDILIFVDRDENRMVIGLAVGAVHSYPTHLEDSSRFLKFFDANAFL